MPAICVPLVMGISPFASAVGLNGDGSRKVDNNGVDIGVVGVGGPPVAGHWTLTSAPWRKVVPTFSKSQIRWPGSAAPEYR
jgi:hypothetical protein